MRLHDLRNLLLDLHMVEKGVSDATLRISQITQAQEVEEKVLLLQNKEYRLTSISSRLSC